MIADAIEEETGVPTSSLLAGSDDRSGLVEWSEGMVISGYTKALQPSSGGD